ncbi:unnamed protein product, partial [Ambrosiozyma monospora]
MQFQQFILFGVLSQLATALPIQKRAYATVIETSLVYETVTADDSTPTSTEAAADKQAVVTTTASSSTEEPNYTYFTWTLGDDLTTTLSFDLNVQTDGFAATFESVIVQTPTATAAATTSTTSSAVPTTTTSSNIEHDAVTTTQAPTTTSSTSSTEESTTSTSSTASAASASSSGDFQSIMLETTNAKRALHG